MNAIKNLTKNVITFLLAAATGAGKTLLASILATKNAFPVLSKGIGNTNSTLTNRKIVYSSNPYLYSHLVVYLKKKDTMIPKILIQSLLTKAWAIVLAKCKTFEKIDNVELQVRFVEAIKTQFLVKNNLKALLRFIPDFHINEYSSLLFAIIEKMGLIEKSAQAYRKASLNLKPDQIYPTSHVFWSAIAEELNKMLDNISDDDINKKIFYNCVEDLNKKLKEVFFTYVDQLSINKDGYYVCDIDLQNISEKSNFINAMFKNNDLSKDRTVSIEALCEEIIIYTGLNEFVKGCIESSNKLSKTFINNNNGFYEFAIFDTMGVFHKDTDEDKSYDYFESLSKLDKFAGIFLLAPLKGDNNVEKMSNHIIDFLSHVNYSTIVFLIRNNLNKYIKDELENMEYASTLVEDDNLFDTERANAIFANAKNQLINDYKFDKNKHIYLTLKKYLAEFRSFDENIKNIAGISECMLKSIIIDILNSYADFVEQNRNRINVKKQGYDEPKITLDKNTLYINFKETYESGVVMNYDKECMIPANKNIEDNKEKTPHGLSYNALKRHLSYGDGFTSNIDEYHFVNCNNINITFPKNLNSLAKDGLFNVLLKGTIKIEGLDVSESKYDEILQRVHDNLNISKITKIMVYDYALKIAEENYSSYYNCFNEMLERCQDFIKTKSEDIDITLWVDALYQVYKEAIDMTFNYGLLITNE